MVRQKDGSKVKMTKYILVLTLSEAHVEFLKSCSEAMTKVLVRKAIVRLLLVLA